MTDTATKPKRARKAEPGDGLTLEERIERDATRYEALAREHGADLSEEAFDRTLKKVGRHTAQPSE